MGLASDRSRRLRGPLHRVPSRSILASALLAFSSRIIDWNDFTQHDRQRNLSATSGFNSQVEIQLPCATHSAIERRLLGLRFAARVAGIRQLPRNIGP